MRRSIFCTCGFCASGVQMDGTAMCVFRSCCVRVRACMGRVMTLDARRGRNNDEACGGGGRPVTRTPLARLAAAVYV